MDKPWFTDGFAFFAVTITPDGQVIMWISHDDGATWRAMEVVEDS